VWFRFLPVVVAVLVRCGGGVLTPCGSARTPLSLAFRGGERSPLSWRGTAYRPIGIERSLSLRIRALPWHANCRDWPALAGIGRKCVELWNSEKEERSISIYYYIIMSFFFLKLKRKDVLLNALVSVFPLFRASSRRKVAL